MCGPQPRPRPRPIGEVLLETCCLPPLGPLGVCCCPSACPGPLRGGEGCGGEPCDGMGVRRVRIKKLVHFVKNLRRGARPVPDGEKPWWKVSGNLCL